MWGVLLAPYSWMVVGPDTSTSEKQVKGNPVRSDGGLLRQEVELLVGPDGVKARAADAMRRDKLSLDDGSPKGESDRSYSL